MTEPSQEIVAPVELVNPMTGELIPADDIDKVATVVRELREMKDKVADATRVFSSILIEESTRQGARTLTAGGADFTVSAPDELEWDIEALAELRDLGLPEERYDALVVATVSYKVNGTEARKISGANPEYKRVIEGAKRRIPQRQYVSFKT